MPRNILSLELSSGGFSAELSAWFNEDSDVVEGVVEAAGEGSRAEGPDDAEAIL